jgi:hypothetical protein
MASKNAALALECKRQSESCLYTSTSLFIWLRFLRITRMVFIVAPLVLAGLAGWQVLRDIDSPHIRAFICVAAFLAGLLPTVYSALKFDDHLELCKSLTGEFKNLRDAFRHAALVSALKPFAEFERDVEPLIRRLDLARSHSYTAPEWCFRRAQKKIHQGDYAFDVDLAEIDQTNE